MTKFLEMCGKICLLIIHIYEKMLAYHIHTEIYTKLDCQNKKVFVINCANSDR